MRYELPICQQSSKKENFDSGPMTSWIMMMRFLGLDPRSVIIDIDILRLHVVACIAFAKIKMPNVEKKDEAHLKNM